MQADIENLRTLRATGFAIVPTHGEAPKVAFTQHVDSMIGIGVGMLFTILTFFIFWAIFSFTHTDHNGRAALTALDRGLTIGIWAMVFYYVYPVFAILFKAVYHGQWPNQVMLRQYSAAQKFISCVAFSFMVCFLANSAAGIVTGLWQGHFSWSNRYISSSWRYTVISVSIGVILGLILPHILSHETKSRTSRKRETPPEVNLDNIPFGLWVGRSTGYLSQLWHRTGVAADQNISLGIEDAAQNILVLGGIGSGKTTRLMQPLLAQLLDQECGGIVFDVKGDVRETVLAIAAHCKVDVAVIGPGENTWPINVLGGLSPEMAASFFKSIFLLSGGVRTEGFWIDTATELCRNTLGVLSFIENHYNLHSLYNYLFDEEFRDYIQEEVNELLASLDEKEQRLLKSYVRYHDNIFANFDEKVKSGVRATIAQVLSPFNHPELIDAFCLGENDTMDMTALFERWIFVVDMPLAQWGLGAKVIYTLIKLRFFNVMQNRIHNPEWNQESPVFFMCDEYQELISASKDGLSDLNFWDKSRSSKTIGIISSQSVSSFYAAIGDHDLANAVLQNFRQKFCFRTEDRATLSLMNDLAGQARVQKMTISQGSSIAPNGKQSTNHNESVTEAREAVLDAPLFRQLEENQVIGLLSVNGRSMDDLFWVVPLYIST